MNSQEIASKKFEKSAMFGYKTDIVDEYITDVAAEFEALEKQNADLKEKLEILARKVREYRNNEEQLKTAILDAQKKGSEILEDSKMAAGQILDEANQEAKKIKDEAQLQRNAMLAEANEEYAAIKAETSKEQEGSAKALENLKIEVSEFKRNLISIYTEHLEKVKEMPEFIKNEDCKDTDINENQISLEERKDQTAMFENE